MKREKKRGGRGRREEEDGDQAKQRPTRYGTTNLVYGSLVLLVNGLPQT